MRWLLAALLIVTSCAGDRPSPQPDGDRAIEWVSIGRPLREAFGIAGTVSYYPGQEARRAFQLDAAQAIGISHYRFEFKWTEIERQPGVYDLGMYEEPISAAFEKGQGMLAVVGYGNVLYSEEGRAHRSPYYPPDDPAPMRAYAAHLVERYKGRIDRWEFWNEPNGGYRFWKTKPGGDAEAFADLAYETAEAMRRVDPSIKIALGGFFYHDYLLIPGAPRFLDAVLAARPELADLYDAVSYHPYKPYPPADPPEMAGSWDEDQDSTVDAMREVMRKHGMGEREIWITENGWPVGPLVAPRQQAQYLVRGALLAFAKGVSEYDWYTFWDQEDPSAALVRPETYFGIYSPGDYDLPFDYLAEGANPPQAKPAFHALRVMLEQVGEASEFADAAAEDDRGKGARVIACRGDRVVAVVWNSSLGGSLDVELPEFAGLRAVSAVGMTGEPLDLPQPGRRFEATTDPAYVAYAP